MAVPDLDLSTPTVRGRDVASVVLILAGMAGLVVCAFLWEPLAGWAAVSTITLALGVALGYDR